MVETLGCIPHVRGVFHCHVMHNSDNRNPALACASRGPTFSLCRRCRQGAGSAASWGCTSGEGASPSSAAARGPRGRPRAPRARGSPVPPAAVGVPNQVAAAGSASAPSASGGLGSPSELLLGAISADIGGSPARAAPGVVAAEAAGGRSLELGPWESTGFVSDLGWAEGRRLTPCLAFRDEGAYRVRVVCVGTHPPIPPEGGGGSESEEAEGENEAGWSGFDWEVGAPTVPDAVDA
ncbi:unnamed protein product [Prorocentrum cordatum]|uniref:Uncharacterized protein n=1 Tax=Prorocentrum cordatum TaxID=2364126 RepID=A0ABN9Q5T1_9DINO|nr:unnamed protein product [Polarella glacialis]